MNKQDEKEQLQKKLKEARKTIRKPYKRIRVLEKQNASNAYYLAASRGWGRW